MEKYNLDKNTVSKLSWFFYGTVLLSFVIFSNASLLPYSGLDEKRIIEGILLLSGGVLFIFFYNPGLINFSTKIKSTIGVLIFLLYLSAFLSHLQYWAFLQVGWYVLIGLSMILFAQLYQADPSRYISWFIAALLIMVTAYSLQVFADLITSYTSDYHPIWPDHPGYILTIDGIKLIKQGFLNFSNVRFFNHLQTWTIPILVFGYLLICPKLIAALKCLFLFLLSSWWMLVFASDARGTMVSCIFGLIVVGVIYRKEAKQFIYTSLFVASAGLALYLIFFLLPDQGAKQILTRGSTSGRIDIWIYTLKLMASNPIFGIGPMHFSHIEIGASFSTPHNFMLQSMVELGIPTTLLLILIVLKGFYDFVVQKKETHLIDVTLVAVFSGVALHSMVSGILNTPLSQVLMTLVLGWMLGEYFSENLVFNKRTKNSISLYLISLFLIANIVFVGLKLRFDIPQLNDRIEIFLEKTGSDKLYPRFWLQGKIGWEEPHSSGDLRSSNE